MLRVGIIGGLRSFLAITVPLNGRKRQHIFYSSCNHNPFLIIAGYGVLVGSRASRTELLASIPDPLDGLALLAISWDSFNSLLVCSSISESYGKR